MALASGTLLVLGLRGLPLAYAVTGLTAVPYLLAASYLAPKIGVGLFLAALIAGQLGGGCRPRPFWRVGWGDASD